MVELVQAEVGEDARLHAHQFLALTLGEGERALQVQELRDRQLGVLHARGDLDALVMGQEHGAAQRLHLAPGGAVGLLEVDVDAAVLLATGVHRHVNVAQRGGQQRVKPDHARLVHVQGQRVDGVVLVLVLAESEVHTTGVQADRAVGVTDAEVGVADADKGVQVGADDVQRVEGLGGLLQRARASKLDDLALAQAEAQVTAEVDELLHREGGAAQVDLERLALAAVDVEHQLATPATDAGLDAADIAAQPDRHLQVLGAVVDGAAVARGVDRQLGLLHAQVQEGQAHQAGKVGFGLGREPDVPTQTQHHGRGQVQVLDEQADAAVLDQLPLRVARGLVADAGKDVQVRQAEREVDDVLERAVAEHQGLELEHQFHLLLGLGQAQQVDVEQAVEGEQAAQFGQFGEVEGDAELRQVQLRQTDEQIAQGAA